MGGWQVSPAKYRECVCGRVCKGLSALQTHGRHCPMSQAWTDAYVDAVQHDRRPPTHAAFRVEWNRTHG